jgi:hypothetical protein
MALHVLRLDSLDRSANNGMGGLTFVEPRNDPTIRACFPGMNFAAKSSVEAARYSLEFNPCNTRSGFLVGSSSRKRAGLRT